MNTNFNATVKETAEKIMSVLNEHNQLTSWDIKMNLKISSSLLYLALGYLVKENKITIIPKGLIYQIEKISSTSENTNNSESSENSVNA